MFSRLKQRSKSQIFNYKKGQIDQLNLFSLPTKTLEKWEVKNTQNLNMKEKED